MFLIVGIIALVFAGCCSCRLSGYLQILGTSLIAVIMPTYVNRIKPKKNFKREFVIVGTIPVLLFGIIFCYNWPDHYWLETVLGLLVSFLFAVAQYIDEQYK